MSWGPDGVKGTPDDVWGSSMGPRLRFRDAVDGLQNVIVGGAIRGRQLKAGRSSRRPFLRPCPCGRGAGEGGDEAGRAGEPAVRLRQYFPETLLFEPALITDGRAWPRSRCAGRQHHHVAHDAMASSAGGVLGSKDAPLRVFQDFFVDLDLPVALTQHDRSRSPWCSTTT